MPTRILVLALGTALALGTVIVAQQHSYTQAEIDAGSRLYESNCGSCHGENGDKIVGIDFSKGTFKTARTDEDMVRVIRNGVPNTGMPPHPFSEAQAGNVVAFVRSMLGGTRAIDAAALAAASLAGDASRGEALFTGKGNCASCHAVNGIGGSTGPDLGGGAPGGGRGGGRGAAVAGGPPAPGGGGAPGAGPGAGRGGRGGGGAPPAAGGRRAGAPAAAGAPRGGGGAARGGGGGGRGGGRGAAPNPEQLARSIVDPNAEMAPAYRIYQIVTTNNDTARGTLLNQDTFSIQMRDSNDKLMSFWKQDLKEFGFVPSPMPSYKDVLSSQEIADLVSYLISLRSN